LQLRAADNYWYPAPNGNDLTNGSGSHYQTTTLTFSNPTVVKLKGNINTNPDLTCYNPTDEDIPSQNSQTKNADSEIASQNGLFYPNPWVSGPLKIQLNLDIETNIVISMTNINGVEVFRHAVNHQPSGQFYSEIPEWNGITSGLYILTVTTNQKSFKEKIVK
jgi:hypothetical protein